MHAVYLYDPAASGEVVENVSRLEAGFCALVARPRPVKRFRQRETKKQNGAGVLTRREIDVARMVAQGLKNKSIAEKLSIGEGTIKVHLHHVYEKLVLDGRLALLIYGHEQGWV